MSNWQPTLSDEEELDPRVPPSGADRAIEILADRAYLRWVETNTEKEDS